MNYLTFESQTPVLPKQKGPIYYDFQLHAQLHPQALALTSPLEGCTYLELEDLSSRLAFRLKKEGIGCGHVVAVYANRNPALIYALFGILKSGAAFFIADAEYPVNRTLECCNLANPSVLLICGEMAVPEKLTQAISANHKVLIWPLPSSKQAALDTLRPYPALSPLPVVKPQDSAYIGFTSGSTGKPKGIVTSHAPLPHFLEWHVQRHGFTSQDRFSFLSGLGHDPALRDIFTPLSIGASLHIPDSSIVFNPLQISKWLQAQKITVVHLTPAMGEIIYTSAKDGPPLEHLRYLFWGGDVLTPKLSENMRKIAPKAAQVNFYGTTETPQAMSHFTIPTPNSYSKYPIGKGISDVQLLIITASGKLAEVDEEGEIIIQTPYLSQGYLGNPEETKQKYIPHPLSQNPDDRCYKTGDMGKYLSDGNVVFLGRLDHQVKIRGFRVELDEIKAKMENIQGIKKTLVMAKDMGRESKSIVAYYTSEDSQNLTPIALKEALVQELPSYMVPAYFVKLDKFELFPNGKVNLQALPLPIINTAEESNVLLTDRERELLKAWQSILGIDSITIHDSFTDLGGDSLSAIHALIAMQKLGIPEELAMGVLRGKTIAQIVSEEQGLVPLNPQVIGPLSETAKTGMWVNLLRGLLITLVVSDHWFPGLLKHLPRNFAHLQDFLNPIFNLSTPGFAFVFGLNLGYNLFPDYLINPKRIKNKCVFGIGLLGGSILLAYGLSLAIFIAKGKMLTTTDIAVIPFGPLLYYFLALISLPLWFKVISKCPSKIYGCLGLMVCCYFIHWMCLSLFLEREQTGILQLARLMLVAKYAYFNMTMGVLGGVAFGIYLSQHNSSRLIQHMLLGGVALLFLGLSSLYIYQGSFDSLFDTGNDMGLWRWLTYIGVILLIAAICKTAIDDYEHAPAPLQECLKVGIVVGLCTLPIYVLHGLVLQVKSLLFIFGVPEIFAILIPVLLFALVCFWLMKKIYRLYTPPKYIHRE